MCYVDRHISRHLFCGDLPEVSSYCRLRFPIVRHGCAWRNYRTCVPNMQCVQNSTPARAFFVQRPASHFYGAWVMGWFTSPGVCGRGNGHGVCIHGHFPHVRGDGHFQKSTVAQACSVTLQKRHCFDAES